MIYLYLAFQFFKVGLFSIGGGLATLPFLYEMAEKTGWFTPSDIADMIAISESTPGAMGINMATYCGYSTKGILGAVTATLALIAPSIIIIIIISQFLKKFKENHYVQDVFYGLRPTSTALIAAAGYEVLKISILTVDKFKETGNILNLFNIKCFILAVIVYIAIKKFNKHPVVYILASAFVGIIFKLGV